MTLVRHLFEANAWELAISGSLLAIAVAAFSWSLSRIFGRRVGDFILGLGLSFSFSLIAIASYRLKEAASWLMN